MSALCLVLAPVAGFAAAWVFGGRPGLMGLPFPRREGGGLKELIERVAAWGPLDELGRRDRSRRFSEECRKGVPEMLDIITLGLSAGLSFDASLDLYCSRFETELSRLLDRTRLSWSLGLDSRAGALERFSMAVVESLTFGAPLADTLVRQAKAIRADHRHRVEEAIEKAPVKLLIPMGVLVLPAMLVAILGPLLAPAFMEMT